MTRWTVDPRSVAVVGMSCRVPGAATPEQLWTLLCDAVDATGNTPHERYDVDAVHSPRTTPGKLLSRRAGYVAEMANFDAQFFGMSTAEAVDMDPQQRLLMMAAWEALEDSGQRPDLLAGSRAGVFVGNGRADYLENAFRQGLKAVTASQYNNVRSMLAARVSHFFDLRGPSIVVDTACSSSLVALHQAVQSLRAGETPFALAAGVNLPLRADEGVMMSQVGTMAADGRSKFGADNADGHAPSDAVVVIALKPLTAAIADGDRIRAVIAGTAIGNDGRSSDSILNASLDGQLEVLRWAYHDAQLNPSDVDYVEAHGSGSPQLDPLELTALAQVLGAGRTPDRPLIVGSVKSNVGHAEAASSLVGVMKAVLCLEHAQVPASLHADNPRTDIDWGRLPIEIPVKLRDLPPTDRPLIAGVSGQGISSLNAHVVLRQAEPTGAGAVSADNGKPRLLTLSARTPQALEELRQAYVAYLGPDGPGQRYRVRDICRSAATRRHHWEHRLAVIGATHEELVNALNGVDVMAGRTFAKLTHRALLKAADRYRAGEDITNDKIFATGARHVQLPTYPWQTERYWHGDTDGGQDVDLTEWILSQHARTEFTIGSRLSDIGIDSLAKLQLIVELQKKTGHEVDPQVLDNLHTVGDLRDWAQRLETATTHA
jgi:acyl transferase domain-containing protein